jgi:hypothetical protein
MLPHSPDPVVQAPHLQENVPVLLLSTFVVVRAQNISPETNKEITNEQLRNLNKPTGLDLK